MNLIAPQFRLLNVPFRRGVYDEHDFALQLREIIGLVSRQSRFQIVKGGHVRVIGRFGISW